MKFCQIRIQNQNEPNELFVHLLREDGQTGCGDPQRDWHGQPAVLVAIHPQDLPDVLKVSQGMCARNGCFPR